MQLSKLSKSQLRVMEYITRRMRLSSHFKNSINHFLNRNTTLFIFTFISHFIKFKILSGMFTFRVTQHIPCLHTVHPLRSCSCWCNFNSLFSTGRSRSRTRIFFIFSHFIYLTNPSQHRTTLSFFVEWRCPHFSHFLLW